MTTSKAISKLALLIVAAATLALHGCSLTLAGLGALSDASKPDQTILSGWQAATIKRGTSINVVLKDGSRLSGKYCGLDRISIVQYAANYSEAREQKPEGILLPALGDSLGISLFSKKAKAPENKLEGTLKGFVHDRILILTTQKGKTWPSEVDLSMVEKIADGRDCAIAGETIKRLIFEGKIPVLSAIVIKDQARKTQWAELDKVSQIEIRPAPKHAALEGFLFLLEDSANDG